jgi:hypothetical protein
LNISFTNEAPQASPGLKKEVRGLGSDGITWLVARRKMRNE